MIPATYAFILPARRDVFAVAAEAESEVSGDDPPVAASERRVGDGTMKLALTKEDKWRLVKPLLGRYMAPLCEWAPYMYRCQTDFY